MKKILLTIVTIILVVSCEPKKKVITDQDLELEKDKIIKVIENFNLASESKDFGRMVEFLGDEVTFFGTDSAEIIKTFAEYKKAIDQQWQVYEKIKYGDLHDVKVFINREANLATIFYGTNAEVTRSGDTKNYYIRGARVLEKKENRWLIVGGLTGIVRSSTDLEEVYKKPEETK